MGNDVLSEKGIKKYLKSRDLTLEVFQSISSTNTVLKARAAEGAAEGLALIAGEQTAGRGRMGRSFYSPADSGLYLSVLLRPEISAVEATGITACAAVAVAEAIEELAGIPAEIKWVNDVLVNGKKVSGILTEASMDAESGRMSYVIVGIGINTSLPAGDFPEELRQIAGAIFGGEPIPELRCRMAAAVLDKLMGYYRRLGSEDIYDAYRKRSIVLGRSVNILSPGKAPVPARVLDIDRDFSLLVQYEDRSINRINSGEVSIRVTEE